MDGKNGDQQRTQPLILSRDEKSYNFIYPKLKTGELTLEYSEKLILACPGKENSIQGIPGLNNSREIEAVCLKGKTFVTKGTQFNITSVSCNDRTASEARRIKSGCFRDGSIIQIGFPIERRFLTDSRSLQRRQNVYHLLHKISANEAHRRPSNGNCQTFELDFREFPWGP